MKQYRDLLQKHKGALDSLEWSNWEDGTRIKYLPIGDKTLRLQEFTSEFIDSTWCEKGHIGFVVQGEMEIDFQSHKVRFPEGSELSIQAGEKHKGRSVTPTVLLFLVEDI